MIGLANLSDGGHVLEHPAGPLYVNVVKGSIRSAELAPWGEPELVSWHRNLVNERMEARIARFTSGKGVRLDRI